VTHVCRQGKRIAVDILDNGAPTERRKTFEVQFVKLPNLWIERLERSNSPGTFKLAHRILKEDFDVSM
jgi:hypothetical protein